MKTLIFSSFNFAQSFLGVMLNELQESVEAGDEVYFTTCSKTFERCGFNLYGLKYACDLCEHRLRSSLPLVEGNYKHIRLEELINADDIDKGKEFRASVTSMHSSLYYNTFDVGDSVLSSYISKTRDRDLANDANFDHLKDLAGYSVMVYLAITRFLKVNAIDKVILFNGRWDYYRAVLRATQDLGINCRVVENFRAGGFIEVFDSSFPHNIRNKQLNFDRAWAEAPYDEAEKIKIGSEFFSRKRRGEVITDKSYIGQQIKNQLPPGLDTSKKIIVVFNSSDDEFAAVGEEYKNPFFKDQSEGIAWLVKLVGEELTGYELIVRMHPNLTGIYYNYAQDIYNLEGLYKNVYIVRPESDVDSYALMDLAHRVVTFGSSTGVESTFWGKPVILLAKAFYFYSDVVHIPQDKEHIHAMLTGDLAPKPQIKAIKIGYYLMKGGTKAKHYDYEYKKKYFFKGKRIDLVPQAFRVYLKILKLLKVRNLRKAYSGMRAHRG